MFKVYKYDRMGSQGKPPSTPSRIPLVKSRMRSVSMMNTRSRWAKRRRSWKVFKIAWKVWLFFSRCQLFDRELWPQIKHRFSTIKFKPSRKNFSPGLPKSMLSRLKLMLPQANAMLWPRRHRRSKLLTKKRLKLLRRCKRICKPR